VATNSTKRGAAREASRVAPCYASYLRVSTDRQGRSGLGLEAQRAAVLAFLNGGGSSPRKEFIEVESGAARGPDGMLKRPVLRAALAYCREQGCTLVIAKLDRLSRSVRFIAELLEARVPIRCADMPEANEFVLHIMAAVAQQERRAASERTRAALAAAKARGRKLGNPKLAQEHARQRAAAQAHAEQLAPLLRQMEAEGLTRRAMLARLNAEGVPTVRGGRWHPRTLQLVLAHLAPHRQAPRKARKSAP
jgi:DNA invertase Pin-like site-specific DNA recombinase